MVDIVLGLLLFLCGMLAQFYLARAFSQPCDLSQLLATQEALIKANNLVIKRSAALIRIARWHGEFPTATDRDGKPSTYGMQYGSNGERDYMRQVALDAIRGDEYVHGTAKEKP